MSNENKWRVEKIVNQLKETQEEAEILSVEMENYVNDLLGEPVTPAKDEYEKAEKAYRDDLCKKENRNRPIYEEMEMLLDMLQSNMGNIKNQLDRLKFPDEKSKKELKEEITEN